MREMVVAFSNTHFLCLLGLAFPTSFVMTEFWPMGYEQK